MVARLDLREVAQLRARTDACAGPKVRERSDAHVILDRSADSRTLAQMVQRSPTSVSNSCEPVRMTVSRPTRVVPRRMTPASSVTSSAKLHGGVEPGARGVDDGHAGALVASSMRRRWRSLRVRQLDAVVDAHEACRHPPAPMGRHRSLDRHARSRRAAAGRTHPSPATARWPAAAGAATRRRTRTARH